MLVVVCRLVNSIVFFFFAMDLFESMVKPTDLFLEKYIYTHKIEVVRFVQVNKH